MGARNGMPTSNDRQRGAWTGVMWMLILLLTVERREMHLKRLLQEKASHPLGLLQFLSPDPPQPNALTGAAPAPYIYTDTRRLEQDKTIDCLDCSAHTNTDNLQRDEKGETDSVDSDSGYHPMKNGSTDFLLLFKQQVQG